MAGRSPSAWDCWRSSAPRGSVTLPCPNRRSPVQGSAALGRMRPIIEIMTVNFSLLALAPATVEDARGMLWPALEDPDPVLIFEHGCLYNLKGTLPAGAAEVDIIRAAVRRTGTDVTLVTYGGSLGKALTAADSFAEEGTRAEVIDLRVLRPLDDETILAPVRSTHRVVIIDEGWRTGSLSAEVAARIAEQAFYDLDAPIERVCAAEVPVPYAKHLEDAALPQPADIVAAARRAVATDG